MNAGRVLGSTILGVCLLVAATGAVLAYLTSVLGAPDRHASGGPALPASSPRPAMQGFPDAASTGVPPGTPLTQTDSLKVTRDGSVIDAKLVHGTILVEAHDVTIRRSKIEGDGAV
ncbi:MAG: hypothetical protein ACRDQW_10890, partial [Haloechinothrix sp.]